MENVLDLTPWRTSGLGGAVLVEQWGQKLHCGWLLANGRMDQQRPREQTAPSSMGPSRGKGETADFSLLHGMHSPTPTLSFLPAGWRGT